VNQKRKRKKKTDFQEGLDGGLMGRTHSGRIFMKPSYPWGGKWNRLEEQG